MNPESFVLGFLLAIFIMGLLSNAKHALQNHVAKHKLPDLAILPDWACRIASAHTGCSAANCPVNRVMEAWAEDRRSR